MLVNDRTPIVTSSINVLLVHVSRSDSKSSAPRKTIFGERLSPVSDIFMAHTHDSGLTTRLWTKHPGCDSLDIFRRDLVYLVHHLSHRDFSIVNQNLWKNFPKSVKQVSEISFFIIKTNLSSQIFNLHCPTLQRHHQTRDQLILSSLQLVTRNVGVQQQA